MLTEYTEHEEVAGYPLQWPFGWRRTPPSSRQQSRFGTMRTYRSKFSDTRWKNKEPKSLSEARDHLVNEIARLGASHLVISTNIPLRNDGLPRASFRKPDDPGVAAYWRDRNKNPRCMACDTFDRVEDNMYAIAESISRLRALERYGTSEIMERAFQAMALPSPDDAGGEPWHAILECSPTAPPDEIRKAYRERVKVVHPDVEGGSEEDFRRVKNALEAGLAAVQ